jgi:biotin carboxyl carrier protein
VPDRNLTYQDLLQIVELIKSSSAFGEFHLKVGDIELDLKRSGARVPQAALAAVAMGVSAPPKPKDEHETPQRHGHVGGGEVVSEAAALGAGPPEGASRGMPLAYPEGAIVIKSPMVGSFYRAPEPGARPFVEVGQQVETNTVVCIIEVMKLMNSIPAGAAGVVTHILVEDGGPVEFGQVLMVIEPS